MVLGKVFLVRVRVFDELNLYVCIQDTLKSRACMQDTFARARTRLLGLARKKISCI